jgi:uncharacterized protein
MKYVFLNESGTLRSGWRSVIFLSIFTFFAVILGTLAQAVATAMGATYTSSTSLILNALASLIPALLVGWLCVKLLEKLPFRSLGAAFTNGWSKHWIVGLAFGAVTLSFGVGIAFAFGGLRFAVNTTGSGPILRSLMVSFLVFAIASAFEEALFRGYILQTFARSGLAWLAILLTSVFFGAVHLGNPNANLISTANTVLAGIWFSAAYLKNRDLWFVWGVHLMWNWMQGSFFGIEVSGLTEITASPLMREIDSGPTWLTGQTYGIEGGIACTIAIIISTIAIYFLQLKPDEDLLAMTSKTEPPA